MGKLKFTLSNIIFWLAIAATCLLLEDVGFLTTNPKGPLNEPIFFMLLTLALGGYLSYFLIEHIKNKVSLDYVLVAVLSLCFAGGMVAIWAFNGVSFGGSNPFEYHINDWDKIHQTLLLVIFIVTIYATLFYFSKNHPSIRKIVILYFIVFAIALVSSIYSWIAEFDAILNNINAEGTLANIQSFFWNANMFSFMLLLGMFACFGLNYYKKNVLSYLGIAYFFIMICIVGCLTGVIVCFASVLLYFLIEIICRLKKHSRSGMVCLTIYLVIVVTLVTLFACSLNFDLGYFSRFCKAIYKNFAEGNFVTFTSRTEIWNLSTSYIAQNPIQLMFGFGFKNSNHVVAGLLHSTWGIGVESLSTHSGYIQVLMNFGIVGVLAYALFIFYFVYSLVRIFKRDPRFASIYALIGFALLVHASMESIIFLNPNTIGIVVCTFFYLPVMNKWKHYKHRNLGDDVIEVSKPKVLAPNLINKSVSKIFMALICVCVSFFIFPVVRNNIHLEYLVINILVILVMCALTMPFIISAISVYHSRKTTTILSIINLLAIAGPLTYLIVRYYQIGWVVPTNAEWLYPALLAMVLIGEAIILGVGKRLKFKNYLATLVGMSKNSFMGCIGAAAIIVTSYFILEYLDLFSGLTYIIYPIIVLTAFYLASYLVPFKDQKAFTKAYNDNLLYSMKMDVLKDRLGDFNEKRRD